ncbi:helix-turn-helix domain-containing protein [Nocardia goodfellowii]|uniref:Transcriptional regulator with XRE-family HTH domain n=1 Tax=Nocardia goodfellowii TaxID=882446 RepID=A0ABS4QHP7_9NOCA|nr:helix-turn-helix transcriptional regulator [Nocardia goodfellowii]MBP2190685.1 transcriptional regulator with XRE-family HTH domain [Nocardia goodfellowii]
MGPESLIGGIGANIAVYRRAIEMSQVDLAARIGKSAAWVGLVERGIQHPERLTDLINISTVLGCRLDDLLGQPIDSLIPGPRPKVEAVAAVREVMLRAAVPGPLSATSPVEVSLDDVGHRVAQAWTTWHTSPTAHRALGRVLPDLLADANAVMVAAKHDDPRRVARALSGTYQIVRQWLHHLPEAELSWIAAERAMHNAREADDPHLIALGAWALSASYRRAGQQEEATRLCLSAADELKPRLDQNPTDDLLADYGMLHLAAAISAAQSDEEGRAWALHRIADEAARSLGARYDPWTMFGKGNVAIHWLGIRAELGHPDAIVDYASRLNVDDVPSVERRARVLIDTARGHVQQKNDEAAVLTLLDAEKISADEIHDSGLVRELLREMLFRDHARARPHVRALALRCRMLNAA